jgi:hypothetical protein
MRPVLVMIPLLVATLSAGCISTTFGREFPSPDPRGISVGKTDKGELRRQFGEPYQVGIDSGDATWRWFFGHRSWGTEQTKDLSVRFNGDGRVKAYSFTSNFPDDMTRLK